MININLLPESMRKKEGLPLPQALAGVAGLVLVGMLVIMNLKYYNDVLPNLRGQKESLQRQKQTLTQEVEELGRINQEISRMNSLVNAVKGLYIQRFVWSRMLADIKNIVNFDPTMSGYNQDMRYLWLVRIGGKGKSISLEGFATAASQVVAMQMPERFLQGFISYSPESLPEKQEEMRLMTELQAAKAEHDSERRDSPELPLQGPKELLIKQQLEELKNIRSGGIAILPFSSFIVPGSLVLKKINWTGAPKPAGYKAEDARELFPEMAWNFNIEITLQ